MANMEKPLLTVVTGRPASGKTSLAHLLTGEMKCPLISRDELKGGYMNTPCVSPIINWMKRRTAIFMKLFSRYRFINFKKDIRGY